MMNRKQALQWLVKNLKEWPHRVDGVWQVIAVDSCHGWTWRLHTGNRNIFVLADDELLKYPSIHKQDWQSAQPAPASNKPSWEDAPEDAKILVQSECGAWNFGSYKSAFIDGGGWRGNGKGRWFNSIHGDAPNQNWRDTLEYRPVVKESLITESEQDAERQYVPTNLARIKQLNDEIELAQLSIESMKIELAERTKEVQDVLNYCKFNA